MKTEGYIKLLNSAYTNEESVLEMNILLGEKTPWHYHTLFSETIEIINGNIEVGINNQVKILQKGETITINPNDKHYFSNKSKEECIIKVTVSPANKNFENSLLIYKRLANDRLASASGTPKRLTDLALFIYLNNSRMVGIQKSAEPIFDYLAQRGIKKGRLKELEFKYCEK